MIKEFGRKSRRIWLCSFMMAAVLLPGCGGSGQVKGDGAAEEQMQENAAEAQMKEDAAAGGQTQENAASSEGQMQENAAPSEGRMQADMADASRKKGSGEGNAREASVQANSGDIGLEAAKAAALQDAGLEADDVTFVKGKMDYDDGRAEYDIEFVTDAVKYEYEVKADDGKILKAEQGPITKVMANTPSGNILEAGDAKAAALSHAGLAEEQAVFSKVELEEDDGRMEYELEFYSEGTGYSCKVDAVSGTVLEMEMEYE